MEEKQTYKIIDDILKGVQEKSKFLSRETKYQKGVSENFDKAYRNLKNRLDETQIKELNELLSLNNTVVASSTLAYLLYGMQIHAAMLEMMKTPVKVIDFYQSLN